MELAFQYASPIELGVTRTEFTAGENMACYLIEFTKKIKRTRLMLGGCMIKYGASACIYPKNNEAYYTV